MKALFKSKSKLDEMQAACLLRIESRGHWVAWIGLLVAFLYQNATGAPQEQYQAEVILFFIMNLYMLVECLRNGIWSNTCTKPTPFKNFLAALVAGGAVTLFTLYRNSHTDWWQWSYWWGPVLAGIFTVALTWVTLQVISIIYYQRRKSLDTESGDREEE